MKLVFLGPPGAGKGTLAEKAAAKYGLAHLSTGELLRAAIAAGSELGRKVRRYVEQGRLVPQEFLGQLVASRLAAVDGFILDGYPRTVEQAEFVDSLPGLKLDAVIFVIVPEEEAVRRLQNRRVCLGCGAMGGPDDTVAGRCVRCGGELATRADDRVETIKRRYEVYLRETAAVVAHYRNAGRLREVDGTGTRDEVWARLEPLLTSLPGGDDKH